MNTGKRLKQLREERGLSQEEVAKLIGVGRTTYVKYESGDSRPVRKLKELMALFNVTSDYILCTDNPESNTPPASPTATAPSLTPDEKALLSSYRQLNTEGRRRLRNSLEDIVSNPNNRTIVKDA